MSIDNLPLRRRLIGLMLAVSFPSGVNALSLLAPEGEVVLGRPVRIAIPIAGDKLPKEVSCFHLEAAKNPEYFPREARLEIVEGNGPPRLIFSTGNWPHPALEFRLVFRCGGEQVEREYVFLSALPTATDDKTPRAGARRPEPDQAVAADGQMRRLETATTLNQLARARYPEDRAARDEFRRQVALLNPGMFPERGPIGSIPLPAGTRLRLPPETMPLPQVSLPRIAKPSTPQGGSAAPERREAPQDRLVISVDAFRGMSPQRVAEELERLGLLSDEQARQFSALEEKLTKLENTFAAIGKDFLLMQEQLQKIEAGRLRAEAARQEAEAQLAEAQTRLRLWEILAMILAAGGLGAASIFYYERLRLRRQQAGSSFPQPLAASALDPAEPATPSPAAPQAPLAQAVSAPVSPSVVASPAVVAAAPKAPLPAVLAPVEEPPASVETLARKAAPDAPWEFYLPSADEAEDREPASQPEGAGQLSHYDEVWNPPPQLEIDTSPHDMAMELAEVMASMGLKQGAAETLIEHIRSHPRETMSHWLKLLDLYHEADLAGQLAESVAELKGKFNVDFNEWTGQSSNKNQSLLEYQHLVTKLVQVWKTAECEDFLINLMLDTREGTRQGFPRAVVEEIILLRAIAEESRS